MRRVATDLTIALAAFALSGPAAAGQASPAGAPPASAERVKELLVAAGVARQGELIMDQLLRALRTSQPGIPAEFWDEMKQAIGSGEFVELLVPLYQKHLSAPDVEAAIAYWTSEPGRRFAAAQPEIMAESEKAGREWALVLLERMKTKLKAAPARELYSGFIDKTGAMVVEPRFSGPGQRSFSEGLAKMEVGGDKCGFIDRTGQWVIPPKFAVADSFSEGLAAVKEPGGDYGYIDRKSAWVIPPSFSLAHSFSERLAYVSIYRDGTLASVFIDRTGKVAFELPGARTARAFSGGLAAFESGGKWGFVDRGGRTVIEARFERVRDARDGMAAVRSGGKWGFLDTSGRIAVAPKFDLVLDFDSGLAPVMTERGKWSYIDRTGRVAIPGPFELALPFGEGLAAVKVGGLFGFIDKTGATVIEPRFDDAGRFREERAPIKRGGKSGFIDKTGAAVIEPRFHNVEEFSDGLALVNVWK